MPINKPRVSKDTTAKDTTSNRPKPMVPKTALKKGTRYANGGKLKKGC